MKKLLGVAAVLFLGYSSLANAATDWTPYLKPMLSGCNYPNPTDALPKKYKDSIVSKKVKGNPKNEGEEIITSYTLKNATAFGQPLAKIEYLQGYEWSDLTLYFKDNKFMALRPQFQLPKLEEYGQVNENNTNGYDVEDGGYLTLNFNKKDKSIGCGSGI